MIKFLMVSTVFSKKQFSIIYVYNSEDVFNYLLDVCKSRNHCIFYPVNTLEDVQNISDLIDEYWQKALIQEIEQDSMSIIMQHNGKIYQNVHSIEHLQNNVFSIHANNEIFESSNFKFYEVVSGK